MHRVLCSVARASARAEIGAVDIADGKGAGAARNAEGSAEEDLAGASRGSVTFPNLLQFLVFLHCGGRGDPCGPSVLRLRPRRCRGGGTQVCGPAPPVCPRTGFWDL